MEAPLHESTATPSHDTGKVLINKLLRSQAGDINADIKRVGLIFKNLTVTAPDVGSIAVKTLPRAIFNSFGTDQVNFVKGLLPFNARPQNTRAILSDFTGFVKPGEMLFVLGSPGSGCSTFLRTAANRSTLSLSGQLSFAGVPHEEFRKKYQRETIYLPEEDRHIAALSVSQTLRFALRVSLPLRIRTDALIEELVLTMVRMFGLEHALNTSVGGAFFPGVSGGERKRVSIAEALAAGSSLQCFDNSTRGLDSSTALDFVKALRTFTDIGQKTTLATLYQAGESVYNHFDKVTLLHEGHQAFFGRTDEAKAYFEQLGFVHTPGQTTAEFLTTVTDVTQRTILPGSSAENIKTAADLAAAFKQSTHYERLKKEITDYEKAQSTEKAVIPSSSYNLGFFRQVWECLRREYQLVRGQALVYYTKWVTTIILCLTIGSMYFDLSTTLQGAFTRVGILFFALILNAWLQFPELFDAHTNRPVLERQGT